jgi:hypothetical protein
MFPVTLEEVVGRKCLIEYRDGSFGVHTVERAACFASDRWPYSVGPATYKPDGYSWSDDEPYDHDIIRVYGPEQYSILKEEPTCDFSVQPVPAPDHSPQVRDAAQRAYDALKEFLELEAQEATQSTEPEAQEATQSTEPGTQKLTGVTLVGRIPADTLWIGGPDNG